VRGNLQAGLQNVALWHERDISHSSVERIIFPATATLTCYMVKRLTKVAANWEVDTEQMIANLELTNGATFSQSVLLALVEAGWSRDDATDWCKSRHAEHMRAAHICVTCLHGSLTSQRNSEPTA